MAFKQNAKKYVRKQVRRAGVALKKRYVAKKGGLKIGQIAKDVMTLKRLVNAEKKRTGWLAFSGQTLGQVKGDLTGHTLHMLSPTNPGGTNPIIDQGVAFNQRSGVSVKVVSGIIKGQFIQQSAANQDIRVVMEVYHVPNQILATSSITPQLYDFNAFAGNGQICVDTTSSRIPEYFRDYRLITRKSMHVRADTVASENNTVVPFQIPIRFKNGLHWKWNKENNTFVEGEIFVILRASSGNASTGTASTVSNIGVTAPNTGLSYSFMYQWFYYDN